MKSKSGASGKQAQQQMASEEQQIQQEVMTPAQRVRSDWRSLLEKVSYKAIVNNIPYLAFLVLLCVLYISNSHSAVEMQRELNAQKKILKELSWKFNDEQSKLIKERTETELIKSTATTGLKPSLLPAYKIETKSNPE